MPSRFGFARLTARLARWSMFGLVTVLLVPKELPASTIVRFSTSLGNVDVRFYDTATPLTVANFLGYAEADRYDGTFIHRNPPGFVVQGGGFEFVPPNFVNPVVDPENPDAPVLNEPGISNQRGTIAMAKVGPPPGEPPTPETINSATSQWFFNLTDNSGPPPELDTQNGGFTAFGRVILDGMSVVDAIDSLPFANLGGGFEHVPLRGTSDDSLEDRLVFINSVDVLNVAPGDYNFDGVVNAADYNLWRNSFGSMTNAAADGNGDGIVDAADYTVWRDSQGRTGVSLSGGAGHGTAVPEPATLVLLALVAVGVALRSLTLPARWSLCV